LTGQPGRGIPRAEEQTHVQRRVGGDVDDRAGDHAGVVGTQLHRLLRLQRLLQLLRLVQLLWLQQLLWVVQLLRLFQLLRLARAPFL
jgi:hypothetical protein